MSDEEKNAGSAATATAADEPSVQPSLDEHTTEPNAPESVKAAAPPQTAPGKWQMPKPKFQQTSGYLPQGYLKNIEEEPPDAKGFAGSEDTTQEQAPFVPSPPKEDGAKAAAAAPAVEPQPDLDHLIPDEPVLENTNNQVQVERGSRLPLIIMGLIGIVVFVVAFLLAVYFLFLANPSGGNNF